MEWWIALALIWGSFLVLLLMGVPVAFGFLLIVTVGAFLFMGGTTALGQAFLGVYASVSSFTLVPVPLFVLMGEVMFLSGVAPRMIDSLDEWLGRLPGRLSLEAVGGGAIFATLSGSSVSATVLLGSVLAPEMEKRGYKKPMSLGPILGSGGLAQMIPPSGLAVILACLARFSVGAVLIAIIIPGLLMAVLYASYIIIRCYLQPSIAPPYEVAPPPLSKRLISLARYVLPLAGIVFLVTGVIFLGIATPSEAAATGALGCFILAAIYGGLNWKTLKKIISSTLANTGMIFMIFCGAIVYSQILAYTGASRGLAELAAGLQLPPITLLIFMQLLLLVMGMFMEPMTIMMVVLPIYLPIIEAVGFNPLWFFVMMLLSAEMAITSPPFGLGLFAMKGVAPADTTMGDIYRAAIPFLLCDLVAMALIIAFPQLALWLPSVMR